MFTKMGTICEWNITDENESMFLSGRTVRQQNKAFK